MGNGGSSGEGVKGMDRKKLIRAYGRMLNQQGRDFRSLAFVTTRLYGLMDNPTYEQGRMVLYILERLTPEEILQTFPPEKRYDGEKWEELDYFTTMEMVNGLPRNVALRILLKHPLEFLMEYQNKDIRRAVWRYESTFSERYKEQTGVDWFESFCKENGWQVFGKVG